VTRFSDLSIRTKLAAILLLTMGVVLVLATAVLTINETSNIQRTMLQELEVLADVVGTNCVSALTFSDVAAARQTLSALQSKPGIVVARILTPAGGVFVTYARDADSDDPPAPVDGDTSSVDVARAIAENGYHSWARRLVLVRKMTLDGELVGFIHVESSLDDLQATMRRFLLTAAAVAVGLFGVALVVAYPFQRVILEPLEELTKAMRRVSSEKDYAIRLTRSSNDELGVLIDGFNDMLAQIDARSQELQQHRADLERRVESRTAELATTNEQLLDASRHKSEFLANMSHELRTPLNAVIGFSEVLSERLFGDLNAKQAQYVEIILRQGQHLLSLINDILDLSKVEAGRMELELSTFDLNAMLESALLLFQERANRQGITLKLDTCSGLNEFVADERKIKQVLLNLLSNAVKFTGKGGRVELSARLTGHCALIAVADTGIGIAPENQQAIFEAFHQVGGGAGSRREGTGLGLALARRFVQLHGGDIAITSRISEGSTFTFTLPIRSSEA
jgi:signal transduction histidine kinase